MIRRRLAWVITWVREDGDRVWLARSPDPRELPARQRWYPCDLPQLAALFWTRAAARQVMAAYRKSNVEFWGPAGKGLPRRRGR